MYGTHAMEVESEIIRCNGMVRLFRNNFSNNYKDNNMNPTTPKPMDIEDVLDFDVVRQFIKTPSIPMQYFGEVEKACASSYNLGVEQGQSSMKEFYEERLKEKDEEIALHSSLAAKAEIKYFRTQSELDKANEKNKVFQEFYKNACYALAINSYGYFISASKETSLKLQQLEGK